MGRRRRDNDCYFTPPALTHAICGLLAQLIPAPQKLLEPAAGGGAFVHAALARWRNLQVTAVDIDPRARAACSTEGVMFRLCDFRRVRLANDFDLALGNPPFNLAHEFVERSLTLVRDGGHVALLLRTGFLHSQERCRSIWLRPGLRWLVPLAERPSFTDDGKTDSTEYSLFVWMRGLQWPAMVMQPLWWRTPAPAEQTALPLFAGGGAR